MERAVQRGVKSNPQNNQKGRISPYLLLFLGVLVCFVGFQIYQGPGCGMLSWKQQQNNQIEKLQLQKEVVVTQSDAQNVDLDIDVSKINVLLFVGVLSKGSYLDRRTGIREGWSTEANQLQDCLVQFFLLENEIDQNVSQEIHQFNDIVSVPSRNDSSTSTSNNNSNSTEVSNSGYRGLVTKVVGLFQHALQNYHARFVLKTDDDSFVNMPRLLIQLRTLCSSEQCEQERLYIGHSQWNSIIIKDPKHKWYDPDYTKNTGLDMYPPYMLGGGYILSRVLLEELMFLYGKGSLIEIPNEDTMIGTWLAATRYERVHLETFLTSGHACCVGSGVAQSDTPVANYTDWKNRAKKFNPQIVFRLCPLNREDQWLVLHKISYSQKLKIFGHLFKSCDVVDDFVQECYDAIQEVVQCDQDLELFDLGLFNPQFHQLYTEFKHLQYHHRIAIQQQLQNLNRPFNFNDTDSLFREIRELNKQNLNSTEGGKICAQILRNGTAVPCQKQINANLEKNETYFQENYQYYNDSNNQLYSVSNNQSDNLNFGGQQNDYNLDNSIIVSDNKNNNITPYNLLNNDDDNYLNNNQIKFVDNNSNESFSNQHVDQMIEKINSIMQEKLHGQNDNNTNQNDDSNEQI